LLLLILLWFAVVVAAQETDQSSVDAPEETDIVLPTRLLEIEDLRVERVDAVLPEPPDIVPPELAFPLPAETDLTVSDDAFQVPDLPDEARRGAPREASVYSTGSVGFGSMNQVSGALKLYKLGTDPRFNFSFAHDSLDGYDFRPPGTGFFRTENTIDGWVGASSETTDFETSAMYASAGEGLQGRSRFYSVETQFLSADAALSHRPDPRVVLAGDMSASSARRLLTVPDSTSSARLEQELVLAPTVGVGLELTAVSSRIEIGYLLRAVTGLPTLQIGSFDFKTDISATDSLYFNLELGVRWLVANRFEYPFRLGTSFSIQDRFTVGLSGGFEVSPVLFADLWRNMPLIAAGADGGLDVPTRWFGEAILAWNLMPEQLVVEGGVEYSYTVGTVAPQGWDDTTSTFPIRQDSLSGLRTSVEGRWTAARGLTLTGAWSTEVLETRIVDPSNELEFGVRYASPEGAVNVGTSFRAPIYDGFVTPIFGIDGSVRVAEGVDIVLEAADLLSPATQSGRPKHAGRVDGEFPFIDPGLRVILKAQLSL
jgi:hypothetical protein